MNMVFQFFWYWEFGFLFPPKMSNLVEFTLEKPKISQLFCPENDQKFQHLCVCDESCWFVLVVLFQVCYCVQLLGWRRLQNDGHNVFGLVSNRSLGLSWWVQSDWGRGVVGCCVPNLGSHASDQSRIGSICIHGYDPKHLFYLRSVGRSVDPSLGQNLKIETKIKAKLSIIQRKI